METKQNASRRFFAPTDKKEEKTIDIPGEICTVAFLADKKHIVARCGRQIRRWQTEDGKQVGAPMDAGDYVNRVVTSRDGRWIVSGTTDSGRVAVWDTRSHQKVTEFKAHSNGVRAIDVSPDGTKIATGSYENTACVWSLSTGKRLLGPWKHGNWLAAVTFSPDGRLIATATTWCPSIQIYHSYSGRRFLDVPFQAVNSPQCLAWANDGKRLFVLSPNGTIHCLSVSNGTTLSQWRIHTNMPEHMSMASEGIFIAVSGGSAISLWDTTTYKQIGTIIKPSDRIYCMAISADYTLMTGGNKLTLRSLHNILPPDYLNTSTIGSLRAQNDCSNNIIANLEESIQQLHIQLSNSQRAFDQKESGLNDTIQSSIRRIAHLEETVQQLNTMLTESQRKTDGFARIISTHEQMHKCETLYTEDRIVDAANSLLEISNTLSDDVKANEFLMDWIVDFTNRCISKLVVAGDERLAAKKHEEALSSYFTALLLNPCTPNTLLIKWASIVLVRHTADDALQAAAKFKIPRFFVYRVICDTLEERGHVTVAIECFYQMQSELVEEDVTTPAHERAQWEIDFRERCVNELERLGDAVMESGDYDAANRHYTLALTLGPTKQFEILLKRSRVWTLMHVWEQALIDANKAIELDSSLADGYEGKRVALLGARRYDEAIDAYNEMLLKLERSPDPSIRELRNQYASPSEIKDNIYNSIRQQQRDAPLVIINTKTGRLCDLRQRIAEFEADTTFKELVASMTHLDHDHLNQTVQEYFRYATLSHTWEPTEPLYENVCSESVHKLPESPTFSKLLTFCKVALEAGLRWAWSDTCCINKTDSSVLQESLTSMFKWYQGSSLTIIHLKGVPSDSDLIKCFWNTRAWTLQEFFASRVIRFYTESWKPYLPHEITYNHKESVTIMTQMAAATGVDASVLLSLRPGSDNVRQKLCLAATRVATKQEDIAYSLFGIFHVSIPVTYGEGQEHALGRLLQEVLTRSGDVTILAWAGKASEYNSCLPAEITVYREPASPYIPSLMEESELDPLVTELQTSLAGTLDSALVMYDLIKHLPPPRLASQRLSLSCIMFPLRNRLISGRSSHQRIYRTKTPGLKTITIKTREDLSGLENLILIHPWMKCLSDPANPFEDLDEEDDIEPPTPLDVDDTDSDADTPSLEEHFPLPSRSTIPIPPQPSQPKLDKCTRALRLFARLQQPFGALLLVPLSNTEYRRVATDNLIVVQLAKNITPAHLVPKICILDIL